MTKKTIAPTVGTRPDGAADGECIGSGLPPMGDEMPLNAVFGSVQMVRPEDRAAVVAQAPADKVAEWQRNGWIVKE